MKISNYTIPKECRRISVEAEGNCLTVTFEPEAEGDFHCEETDHIESLPTRGDLSIFWDEGEQSSAIIARMDGSNFNDDGGFLYGASNGAWYGRVMRFRSHEQYETLIKS